MKQVILILAFLITKSVFSQCDCNCKKYIPKNKNTSNSPIFDTSKFQSRSLLVFNLGSSYVRFVLMHDSIDYLMFNINQNFNFRQTATLFKGQQMSIVFSDSSTFTFKTPENLINRNPYGKTTETEFYLPFSDSIRGLLKDKNMIGFWISNQGTLPRIQDRYYKCIFLNNSILNKFICCFDDKKRKIQE